MNIGDSPITAGDSPVVGPVRIELGQTIVPILPAPIQPIIIQQDLTEVITLLKQIAFNTIPWYTRLWRWIRHVACTRT